jgi:hypothetical protein
MVVIEEAPDGPLVEAARAASPSCEPTTQISDSTELVPRGLSLVLPLRQTRSESVDEGR